MEVWKIMFQTSHGWFFRFHVIFQGSTFNRGFSWDRFNQPIDYQLTNWPSFLGNRLVPKCPYKWCQRDTLLAIAAGSEASHVSKSRNVELLWPLFKCYWMWGIPPKTEGLPSLKLTELLVSGMVSVTFKSCCEGMTGMILIHNPWRSDYLTLQWLWGCFRGFKLAAPVQEREKKTKIACSLNVTS